MDTVITHPRSYANLGTNVFTPQDLLRRDSSESERLRRLGTRRFRSLSRDLEERDDSERESEESESDPEEESDVLESDSEPDSESDSELESELSDPDVERELRKSSVTS